MTTSTKTVEIPPVSQRYDWLIGGRTVETTAQFTDSNTAWMVDESARVRMAIKDDSLACDLMAPAIRRLLGDDAYDAIVDACGCEESEAGNVLAVVWTRLEADSSTRRAAIFRQAMARYTDAV